ncbi:DUF262 domain-containing protein [Parvibaculum sp.]|uniref:DUF262 domain-containing protein n=1 Tax=Parvibaculum sp. TaxID=2024848 RepID=UPI00391A8C91
MTAPTAHRLAAKYYEANLGREFRCSFKGHGKVDRVSRRIKALEDQALYEDDTNEVPPSDIVAYNELRSCADLFRMANQGILDIQPDFQRDIVWKGTDQTRFVDSLIKQLPIPSMCFAMDHRAQRWIVIDGLQRISTIVRFLRGEDWRLSQLDDINQDIAGKTAAAIKTSTDDLHQYYSRVENQTLPINVLRCNFQKREHMEYLFTIFHRLNAGGIKLNNQEIRNCIFSGPFNELLKDLDQYVPWRKLNRMSAEGLYRFTKQELILRFFAFLEQRGKYKGQVAKFLNSYMHENRNADLDTLDQKSRLFRRTVDVILRTVFSEGPPTKMPVTIMESLLVGVAANIERLESIDAVSAHEMYVKLIEHPHFSEDALAEGLSKKPKVEERFSTAVEIFAGR